MFILYQIFTNILYRRYTIAWENMLDRRNEVREEWLAMTIVMLNSKKSAFFSFEHAKVSYSESICFILLTLTWILQTIKVRYESEQIELSTPRKITSLEKEGRISGSTEWKDSRNESGDNANKLPGVMITVNANLPGNPNQTLVDESKIYERCVSVAWTISRST